MVPAVDAFVGRYQPVPRQLLQNLGEQLDRNVEALRDGASTHDPPRRHHRQMPQPSGARSRSSLKVSVNYLKATKTVLY